MTTFYHYTCEHGHRAIGDEGKLVSAMQLAGTEAFARMPAYQRTVANIIWLTDMDVPDASALGLTRNIISCDRTAHRYRVLAYEPIRYVDHRRELPKRTTALLESAPGARPMHWWLAYTPVPVVYDPVAKVA